MSGQGVIQAQGLTRDFKHNRAVDHLDLVINTGELFGLVGPDGAGKTTVLRLLAGLLDITDGIGQVAGFDLATQAEMVKPHIGYMAQAFSLYGELTVQENLSFFAELYDVPRSEQAVRMTRLLEFAGLGDFKTRRAKNLSGGMQKKLALACTLIHQPKILLLDEPTTGVDPVSRREFWQILTELHLEGTTILVSTPYMDEADRCSRVGLMYKGKLIRCDTPQVIRAQVPGELIQVQPNNWQEALNLISPLPGVLEVQTYGELLHVLVDSAAKRESEIIAVLEEKGSGCRSVRLAPPRMEEAFISLIRQIEAAEENAIQIPEGG